LSLWEFSNSTLFSSAGIRYYAGGVIPLGGYGYAALSVSFPSGVILLGGGLFSLGGQLFPIILLRGYSPGGLFCIIPLRGGYLAPFSSGAMVLGSYWYWGCRVVITPPRRPRRAKNKRRGVRLKPQPGGGVVLLSLSICPLSLAVSRDVAVVPLAFSLS